MWDPHVAVRQSIVLRAQSAAAGPLVFRVDGLRLSPRAGETSVVWPLHPGEHQIWVESGGLKSDVSKIRVEE